MELREEEGVLVVRLDPGEAVVESLVALARRRGLDGASLGGIGAVGYARLGFFLPGEKRYATRELRENLEVLSLSGNLAAGEQGPIVHAHAALGRADFSVVGGHLFEAEVSVTLELFLTPTGGRLARALDPRFDLNLLRLA